MDVRAAIGDYIAGSVVRIRSQNAGNGRSPIVVELNSRKLLYLDSSMMPRREVDFALDRLTNFPYRLALLLDWTLTSDGRRVIGYADLYNELDIEISFHNWRNGFIEFDLEDPGSFSIYNERLFPDDMRVAMNVGLPLIASIGRTAYIVRLDRGMGLWMLNPHDKELQYMEAFPQHLLGQDAPMLPSFQTLEQFSRTMKVVDQATMPTGLWAWDNALFLLSRTNKKGQPRWYLSKIDPNIDKVLWTIPLPGAAQHITVIPGPHEWAFLEKTRIAPFNETTHHIRFVKSAHMQSVSLKSLCN